MSPLTSHPDQNKLETIIYSKNHLYCEIKPMLEIAMQLFLFSQHDPDKMPAIGNREDIKIKRERFPL